MASTLKSPSQTGPPTRLSFTAFTGANSSILLEKARHNVRRSTPDSEALASSDDEQDHHHHRSSISVPQTSKPRRRSSWLNEVQPMSPRKASFAGSGSYSPASSHPATPSADQTSWNTTAGAATASNVGRGHSNSTSFPWGNGIWNIDGRKEPPSRLTEVLPSPTTALSPGQSSFYGYGDEPMLSPSASREHMGDSAIPFAIPLHPTPKTYRSQSYSVGQLDQESTNAAANVPNSYFSGRIRNGSSYSGLHHRPSRPSMLGETLHDGGVLGRVREVDDDDESTNGSEEGVQLTSAQARTIEHLAMENAVLRQAAANHGDHAHIRERLAATSIAVTGSPQRTGTRANSHRFPGSLPEETSHAIDELDELIDLQPFGNSGLSGRRFSEYGANIERQILVPGTPENRKLESVKKGHWQSSLGFGGFGEAPQSRRHSFADITTRNGSISSVGEFPTGVPGTDGRPEFGGIENAGRYGDGMARRSHGDSGEYAHFRMRHSLEEEALELEHLRVRNYAATYFSGMDHTQRSGDVLTPSALPPTLHQAYVMQNPYGRQHVAMSQPYHNQLLYVVTFKCSRSDVFYIQEGTGLQVKPGDLVIVEADRGTDLGTVAHENVTWSRAKELKEHYAEEHYKWLMVFSRQGQNGLTNALNSNDLSAASEGAHTSAVGGMGPLGHPGNQETPSNEMKPKMIKRLAQNHEIQTLRDKEGNEAKAKRVCQQKVVEHRLNMEILDAEFQMDWKKLTFYYFADAYINFNSLVTDLFKIYKTRIWMSAINPASFATPTTGLQPPSGIGPGALRLGRASPSERRQQQQEHLAYGDLGASRSSHGAFGQPFDRSVELSTPRTADMAHVYNQPYQQFSQGVRQPVLSMGEYLQGDQPQMNSLSTFNPVNYGVVDSGASEYTTSVGQNENGLRGVQPMGTDWVGNFQGLSLGL